MNGLRKRKKLSAVQLFTFAHAAHTSLLISFTYVNALQLNLCLHARKIYATVEIHLYRQKRSQRLKLIFF